MEKRIKDLNCILLIDDDGPTNYLHKLAIEATGIQTHIQISTSGEEALNYLNCEGDYAAQKKYPQPGLILLDINMPGMNGWEFLEEYEKLSAEKKAKIVLAMLTTSLNPDDRLQAGIFHSVSGYYTKPLTTSMLEEIMDKYFPLDKDS